MATIHQYERIFIPKFPVGFMANLEEVFETMTATSKVLDKTFGEDEESYALIDGFNESIYNLVWSIVQAVVGGATINNPELHRKIYIFIINNLHLMNLDTQTISQYGKSIMKQGSDVVPV